VSAGDAVADEVPASPAPKDIRPNEAALRAGGDRLPLRDLIVMPNQVVAVVPTRMAGAWAEGNQIKKAQMVGAVGFEPTTS
jgi:hypothetical protein